MSTPYPPQPRRLMRDPSNKLIGGVCSGLAKYLNMDVNLVRILTVLISLFTGVPIVLYIIALFVLPEERNEQQPPYVNGPQAGAYGAGYQAQAYQQPPQPQRAQGDDVWGAAGAPWEQPQAAPTNAPAPAPQQQTWQQPSWQSSPTPATEPTAYDTVPTAAGTDRSTGDAPATAAPAETPAGAAEPEPVPETEATAPADEETSSWESAPADPEASQDTDKKD